MRSLRRSFAASAVTMLAVVGLVFAGGYSSGGGPADLSTATGGPLSVANGGTGITSGTSGGVLAFTASGTIASSGALAANSLVKGGGAGVAPSTITTGTGIITALGINTGSAGAPVLFNGALGTPSSGTLTSCTGLPINTGLVIASEAQGDVLYRGASAWARLGAGTNGQVLTSGGASANPSWTTISSATVDNSIADGRLTLTSGTPVTTGDVTGATSLYYALYKGNRASLYNGSGWTVCTFGELTLATPSLTSGKNYDIWLDYNGGTAQLVLGNAWTDDTTRADAIALQDGVWVKSGTPAYRLIGVIRASGTDTMEDSASKRFVWNACNQVPRPFTKLETGNWNYTSGTVRPLNNNTANRVQAVCGLAGCGLLSIRGEILIYVSNGTTVANGGVIGIDEDGTTGNDATLTIGAYQSVTTGVAATYSLTPAFSTLNKPVPLGFHFWQATEGTLNAANGTVTWYADTANGGLNGTICN